MRILLRRGGGIGDVLCLTSALPGLRAKYPGATLDFQTSPGHACVLWGHPLIDTIIERPYDENLDKEYDLVLEPDHAPIWRKPIPYIQCELLEVPFSPPKLYLSSNELRAAEAHDIVIWNHTTPQRSYDLMDEVVTFLKGQDIVQIDNGPSLGCDHPSLSMRQACGYLGRARVGLGVDTSFMHVAVALGIPQVIVFSDLTGPHNQYVPDTTAMHRPDAPVDIAAAVLVALRERRFWAAVY